MSGERRFRLLLTAYPRGYRDARGEEMLEVLLATEARRGSWSVLPEALSLVAHGLALRARQPFTGRSVQGSVGLAGVGLLLLLAVLGFHQLAAMGLRGLGLDGYPDAWQLWRVWVDPRWPIQLAWLATGLALLLRRHRTAVVLVWTAVLLHAWLGLVEVATGLPLVWIGDVGPAWDVLVGTAQASWLVLSVLAALLVGGPVRLARALDAVSERGCRRVLLAGLVGSAVAFVAAPVAFHVTAPDGRLSEDARGPVVALLLAGLALLAVLRRSPYGREAVVLLAGAALVPLSARWDAPSPLPVVVAGVVVFAAGYALGAHRRPGAAA